MFYAASKIMPPNFGRCFQFFDIKYKLAPDLKSETQFPQNRYKDQANTI